MYRPCILPAHWTTGRCKTTSRLSALNRRYTSYSSLNNARRMKNPAKNLPVLVCLIAGLGCTNLHNYNAPADYDLANPVVYKMPSALNEISGIAFRDGNAD